MGNGGGLGKTRIFEGVVQPCHKLKRGTTLTVAPLLSVCD